MNVEYRFVDSSGLEHVHTAPKLSVVVRGKPDFFYGQPVGVGVGPSVVQIDPVGWRLKGETEWREVPGSAQK